MKQNLSIALIILSCCTLIFELIQKLTTAQPYGIRAEDNTANFTYLVTVVSLVYYVLFIYHLVQKKYWFMIITFSLYMISIIVTGLAFEFAITSWRRQPDFSTYEFLVNVSYWTGILFNVACIWNDRKNFSWLSWYGAALAFQSSVSKMYLASDGRDWLFIFFFTSFIPGLLIIGYFISEYRKN